MIQRRILPAVPLLLSFLAVLLALALPPRCAHGADLLTQIHPYITLSEEYTDNLYLDYKDEEEDFITTISPGISFSNMGPKAGIDLDYHLGYVMHAHNSDRNYVSHNASVNAKYITADRVGLYFRDSFIRSEDPREREYFSTYEENQYVLSTRHDRAVYWRNVAAPTIEYQFGPENRVGLHYRNNIYETESSTAQDSQENYFSPYMEYWFNRQHGVSLDYGLTLGSFEDDPDLVGHRVHGRYTNRFSEKTSIFVEHAYSLRTFDDPGVDYDIHEPGIGITHAFTPTLTATAQAGYYWQSPEEGEGHDGFSYRADLRNTGQRTTYLLSAQGGYTEDYFTSDNLGFTRYHRIVGSVTHQLERRLSVGARGSVEWAKYEQYDRDDTIWEVGGIVSYRPLRWLQISLDVAHREDVSDDETAEYAENRAVLSITATY